MGITPDVSLHVCLTPGYPSAEPPIPTLEPADLSGFADDLLSSWHGESCVFQWAEQVREAMGERETSHEKFLSITGIWAQKQLSNLAPGEAKTFPASLSAFQRLVLHRLAEKLNWAHES